MTLTFEDIHGPAKLSLALEKVGLTPTKYAKELKTVINDEVNIVKLRGLQELRNARWGSVVQKQEVDLGGELHISMNFEAPENEEDGS